jgi:hypothetical protein
MMSQPSSPPGTPDSTTLTAPPTEYNASRAGRLTDDVALTSRTSSPLGRAGRSESSSPRGDGPRSTPTPTYDDDLPSPSSAEPFLERLSDGSRDSLEEPDDLEEQLASLGVMDNEDDVDVDIDDEGWGTDGDAGGTPLLSESGGRGRARGRGRRKPVWDDQETSRRGQLSLLEVGCLYCS